MAERVRIRTPDVLRDRVYRALHRRHPDPSWWTVIDSTAKPTPHHEIFTFGPTAGPFRFIGFDVTPAHPFIVHALLIDEHVLPMAYPFNPLHLYPKKASRSIEIPEGSKLTLNLFNMTPHTVEVTVRLLSYEDLMR